MEQGPASASEQREQRMLAVAKLKRAASLPRMKDGRRPPMHVEAVSEGEKGQTDDERKSDSTSTPPAEQPPEEPVQQEIEIQAEDATITPDIATRPKRRSRSRTRSRGSRDLKGKPRVAQTTPSPLIPGDSSQDEGPPAIALPLLTPLMSPIPSPVAAMQRSRLLRSPTPTTPEPSLYYPGTSPPTPIPLPSLEALQKGLFRSNSAGSVTVGRRLAMHKLTGGTDTYDPSPSPTPPPLPGKLSRNNTVSGGERNAARQFMLSRLGGRITKDTDGSGGEEITSPSPTPKRRRRRSRRGSANATTTGVSDSEFLSTSPNTPVVPPTPLPPGLDNIFDFRARSATPNEPSNQQTRDESMTQEAETPSPVVSVQEDPIEHGRPERARRRSVVVEEEDEDHPPPPIPPHPRYTGLPSTPPLRQLPNISALRVPHASDAPSHTPTDSGPASAVGVPVYISQRTSPQQDLYPISPFTTPLKEKQSRDEDEEEVLYHAENYRSRVALEDHYSREISWVASPVPEIRMPIDDDDPDERVVQEDEEEPDSDERPLSRSSSNAFSPQEGYDNVSPRVSVDSKGVVVESETSPEPSYIPPSPSSIAALSPPTSIVRAASDDSTQTYPTRLSVASRMQGDRSPLTTDFEWDDRGATSESSVKRTGDAGSTSTWEKVKNTFTRSGSASGRRSRSNSVLTRERRDHTESSVSRESGASLTSAKTDKGDQVGMFASQQAQQPLMQSPSASASILSLGGGSPIPLASSADLLKYQDAKLFPFPGMKKLEEQRRAKGLLSSSTPDVSIFPDGINEDHPHYSASSFSITPGQTPDLGRDRKLSHQASDSRLLAKYTSNSPPASMAPSPSSHPDYFSLPPLSPTTSPSSVKLPMTLPGVKQWLSKNKKMFSSQTSTSTQSVSPPPTESSRLISGASKKPSLSDLIRRKEAELGRDWEDVEGTPMGVNVTIFHGMQGVPNESRELEARFPSPIAPRPDHLPGIEQIPKAKSDITIRDSNIELDLSYINLDPHPSLPSPPDILSATPDPSSSLSDYPAPSTSESSSTTSSHYSIGDVGFAGPQGSLVLERLEENLARGARSPMWASAIDDPARKLLLSSPVLQVVNANTVKDRFLFLFTDILVIAKPMVQDQDNIIDSYKPTPMDRKYIVKSVVLLHQLRFSADRSEPPAKTTNYTGAPRNPLIRTFVHQFCKDADHAISTLFTKSGTPDDPLVLGQLLFKTLDLDRARLGDYLSRRTSKLVLKAYLDSFGFVGIRIDRALRAFLHSVNIPSRTPQNHSALDYLLDAFASRWYDANVGVVAYDKDVAIRLVRALVQLNQLLHDGIAQEPGPTGYPRRHITSRDFVDAFRRYDTRYLVSDETLEDLYDSILHDRLSQARTQSSSAPDILILIKRPLPVRLTYKIQSEPIIFRIPQADPLLSIELFGQDLTFDPPILTFARSSEASFRVMGTSLGSKTMIMCRSGPNALKYTGLPLSNPLVVERAFMRNTFQLAFLNHRAEKRRYMFSVDDPLIRHQWAVSLKRQIDNATATATASLNSISPGPSKFHRAAELVAFKILQDTLIGSPPSSETSSTKHYTLQRHIGFPRNGNAFRFPSDNSTGKVTVSSHVRSKSRSQVYHRHGAGRNELDLNIDKSLNGGEPDSSKHTSSTSYGQDQSLRAEGPLWSGRDLEMQCQQNSSIALVLSFLQVGAPS